MEASLKGNTTRDTREEGAVAGMSCFTGHYVLFSPENEDQHFLKTMEKGYQSRSSLLSVKNEENFLE